MKLLMLLTSSQRDVVWHRKEGQYRLTGSSCIKFCKARYVKDEQFIICM